MVIPHQTYPRLSSEKMRKLPTQERAQRTLETIFEATAQIVEEQGRGADDQQGGRESRFSHRHALPYFPSKQAILLAMIERERRRVMSELQALQVQAQQSAAQVVRAMRHLLVQSFDGGPRPRRAMSRLAWRMGHHDTITQTLRQDRAKRMGA